MSKPIAILTATAITVIILCMFFNTDDVLTAIEIRAGDNYQTQHKYMEFFCAEVHPTPQVQGAKMVDVQAGDMEKIPLKMALYANSDVVSGSILRSGGWETKEVRAVMDVLRSSPRDQKNTLDFLDIGSNLGWFSINVAAAGYSVVSIDAMRENGHNFRATLCENPAIAKRVAFFNMGLSDKPAHCRILSGEGNRGDGKIECADENGLFPALRPKYVIRQALDMVRLDSIVKQNVIVLKIDIEGHELRALLSGSGLFANYKVQHILSEVSDSMMGRESVKTFLRLLSDSGYLLSMKSFQGPYFTIVNGSEPSFKVRNLYCTLK